MHIQPLDEKSHPIQWTELPTSALVGAGSWWPNFLRFHLVVIAPPVFQVQRCPFAPENAA